MKDYEDERVHQAIQRDVEIHMTHKLRTWVKDGAQLCELVGLPAGETLVLMMMKVLLRTLAKAMPKDKFLSMMEAGYDCATKDNAQMERKNAADR